MMRVLIIHHVPPPLLLQMHNVLVAKGSGCNRFWLQQLPVAIHSSHELQQVPVIERVYIYRW